MITQHLTPLALALAALLPTVAAADQAFPATLAGHALLPAKSFISPPKDAPASLATSGKYTGPESRRVDVLESLPGNSYLSDKAVPRPTHVALPFRGQPIQGFSGIKHMGKGHYWVLQDNGYGARNNSADAMLMVHRIRPDWHSGGVKLEHTAFIHDPDRKVPFLIVNEGTTKRYLTGADFDIESIQPIGDALWLGDELGPYLLKTDLKGKVLAVFETKVDGKTLKSPDHFSVSTPATSGTFTTIARRSRGYEGMAASKDGRLLYPLLEGPLWNPDDKKWDNKDGREYLRILEFSVDKDEWTGRSWKYALEQNGNNIGDFNMIDADTGLIIERDNGEGLPEHACDGPARPDCQNVPAKFKRIYKISLKEADSDGFVKKIGHIDLLNIQDPKALARRGGKDGKFTFPFVTIEDVDVVDGEHIIVANDNNLPYSAARQPNLQDDNELILLRVPELLNAR